MKTLLIHASTPYTIHFSLNALSTSLLATSCKQLNKQVVLITDSNLEATLGRRLQCQLVEQGMNVMLLAFPAGEKHKTRDTKQYLEDALLAKHYGRDTCLIALGGGVVLDLVGFLAATYCRGVPVIYVPTTLLAMVDASIGGKTGVNTPHGKNLIGTFSPPYMVIIDPQVLASLPDAEWKNGVVEMIKHGVIADQASFDALQQNQHRFRTDHDFLVDMIYASCMIKCQIVEQDETEQGIRQLLNFGHTIGHAIEALEHYDIGHGEAVAIGMLVECYLAVLMGLCPATHLASLHDLLRAYGLGLKTNVFQQQEVFLQQLLFDKKTMNKKARFVLLDAISKPYCRDGVYASTVDALHLEQALAWARVQFSS